MYACITLCSCVGATATVKCTCTSLTISIVITKMDGSVKGKKRKRSVVTIETKLEIIEAIEKGKSQRRVAELFEIAKSTVADIWKDREKLKNFVSTADVLSLAKKKCIVRESQFPLLDDALSVWFTQLRGRGAPVPGAVIQSKALEMFATLYPGAKQSDFKASDGWLDRFKKRHGIRELTLKGESMSADLSKIDPFKQDHENIIAENK